MDMDYRQLGRSGLRVPAIGFGTGTFGGQGPLFAAWGRSDAAEARRLVDICLDAGVTLFDTADVYSGGASEEILGQAIRGRRDDVIVSTKTGLPTGDGPQDWGTSRARLVRAVEAALRRLGTDRIDLLQLHASCSMMMPVYSRRAGSGSSFCSNWAAPRRPPRGFLISWASPRTSSLAACCWACCCSSWLIFCC